ncbi:MAG: hypothetical protein R3Y16_07995 [Rikenellaceae bacterium]
MKQSISLIAILIATIAIGVAQQFQEAIYLNNGSVIKGTIIEQIPNSTYKIETSDGSQFVYQWDEVSKIAKERTTSSISDEMKYQGEVQTGFGIGTGLLAMDRIFLQTIQGVRVNENLSAGLGIGLNMIMPYEFDYSLPELFMPIFVNVKGYLAVNENTSMFASLDLGGAFGLTEGVTGISGVLFAPSVGVSLNGKVNISLGYDVQKITDSILSLNMNAVTIKVGRIF